MTLKFEPGRDGDLSHVVDMTTDEDILEFAFRRGNRYELSVHHKYIKKTDYSSTDICNISIVGAGDYEVIFRCVDGKIRSVIAMFQGKNYVEDGVYMGVSSVDFYEGDLIVHYEKIPETDEYPGSEKEWTLVQFD